MLSWKCCRRTAGTLCATSALLIVLAQSASGMYVFNEEIGEGDSAFKFAIINDLHVGDTNSPGNISRAVNLINHLDTTEGVLFVVIPGDLGNECDTTANGDLAHVKDSLKRLTVPYVPLPGNHDVYIVPRVPGTQ